MIGRADRRKAMSFLCLVLVAMPWRALANPEEVVQAQVFLTVSESKRLIARAVAQMPIVQQALTSGMVIIARGTTNTYVAEEILGEPIERGTFVTGRVYPRKGGKRLPQVDRRSEIILVDGKPNEELSYTEAVTELGAGDVMIKGGNALDYENGTAGVYIGSSTGGTTGKFMPYVVARKAHLVIPIGLEKAVTGNLVHLSVQMRQPVAADERIPSMFLLTGQIVTEIEALQMLAGVLAFQTGAGGIGGAEGSVHLMVRGSPEQVAAAQELVEGIQGEPAFVE